VYKGVARDSAGEFPGKHEKGLIVKLVSEQTRRTSEKYEVERKGLFSAVSTGQETEVAIYVLLRPVSNTSYEAQCPSKP
jgi:hypothetical protein